MVYGLKNLYFTYLDLKTDTTLLQQRQRAGVWHANDNFGYVGTYSLASLKRRHVILTAAAAATIKIADG